MQAHPDGYKGIANDRRHLFDSYRVVDIARKVVGVGSVGTRAWVILLLGRDESDPLVLQAKEAGPSVLEPLRRPQPLPPTRPARRGGPAPHAGRERHVPRVAAGHGARRPRARLLRPPALGRQGVRGPRDAPRGVRPLRRGVRLDAGPGARALGRPRRDRLLPRRRQSLRRRDRRVRRALRGRERARLRDRSRRPPTTAGSPSRPASDRARAPPFNRIRR